jgi:PAS domain S-box-containing protein
VSRSSLRRSSGGTGVAGKRPGRLRESASVASQHRVQFYEDDAFLLDSLARFVGGALGAGDPVVAIATVRHLADLEKVLGARGLDVAGARASGRYVDMDAAVTLSKLMVDGQPDPTRFSVVVGGAISRAAESGAADGRNSQVHAFGEMVALLWADGKPEAAIRLEELWSDLARRLPLSLLCAYPITAFRGEGNCDRFLKTCEEHSEVIPAESYTALTSPEERLRAIAYLQLKASALETEKERRRQLEEGQSRLAAIVASSDDAIVGKTLEGIVTSWNAGAERVFGYTAQEMIGQPISRLLPADRTDDLTRILDTIRRGERVDHFETQRIRKDGRRIFVSLTVSPIRDAAGRIVGASKIARDVTDRRRLDEELKQLLGIAQRAYAESEAANRSKDEFLAMLGHELRNPLSAVRNAVLSARLDARGVERALEIASRQTDQLARLIDDLLDVAQVTHGRIRLHRESVCLAEVIERAVQATRFLIEERGLGLSLSLPSEDVRVQGDPARLEQVIVNLVSNAAKYTGRGGRIEVLAERRAREAVIRVRDNGVGIAPEMLPRIFDLFVQAGRGLDRTQGGLGIGLTVVRSLVALHGGRVEAHSEGLGKGAEFVVHLPAVTAPLEGPAIPASSVPARRSPRARILIVEDNSDAAEGLMMLLEAFGHDVKVASDGPTGLQVAADDVPELMFVDIGLPEMDGYEVARRARRSPVLREVILVALTGYGQQEARERALAAGFDHHLLKPVDASTLRSLIEDVASRSQDPVP